MSVTGASGMIFTVFYCMMVSPTSYTLHKPHSPPGRERHAHRERYACREHYANALSLPLACAVLSHCNPPVTPTPTTGKLLHRIHRRPAAQDGNGASVSSHG